MIDLIEKSLNQLPEKLYEWVDKQHPFVFLDFEVFANDVLLCFSVDGKNIKCIVNDMEKIKSLFLHKFNKKILIAYNGLGYDKYIMLAILNGLNPKEVNDNIIHEFNFNFYKTYGNQIKVGNNLIWYDPTNRSTGSLKTYEACEGDDIYESEVSFDLDRKLTEDEINETIKYCSFDVKKLIQYFYKENFDTFLCHLGLVIQTIEKRKGQTLSKLLPTTDASLAGMYLCTTQAINTTKSTDCITLPNNIQLGKYKDQIHEFLKIPINTLKTGQYNDLNSWSLNIINKTIKASEDVETLNKLISKEDKLLNSIKKLKTELISLNEKEKITEKQIEKRDIIIPEKIKNYVDKLNEVKNNIEIEKNKIKELNELIVELNNYESGTANYNYVISKMIPIAIDKSKLTESTKNKLQILLKYLQLDDIEIKRLRYLVDKKTTIYNSIMIVYPFEMILNIKNLPHAFKTGGIHSQHDKPLMFDKSLPQYHGMRLIIADVGSLYPNIMRIFNLCSKGMDNPKEYTQMISDRIVLKKKHDPYANVLKLVLNTVYGCMGSDFNLLYDPTNRLKVCIYGEACIVDLLDKLEDNIKSLIIYQSNTDGIIIACKEDEYDLCETIIHDWENRTGLEMEIEECEKLYQRTVSTYLLVKNK